jgi:hypothetical protein
VRPIENKSNKHRMKTRIEGNSAKLDPTSTTTGHNNQSGIKVAAKSRAAASDKQSEGWAGRWSNLSADHMKRWEKRLYVAKSGGIEVGKLAVRIQHLGKRDEFRFATTNRQAAAVEALGVFRFLKANG